MNPFFSISAGIQLVFLGLEFLKELLAGKRILDSCLPGCFFCLFVAHRYEGENVDMPSRIMKENQNK